MPNWRDFKAKMKANRKDKGKGKKSNTAENETLIVQRLSMEVSGKVQKYQRIGARVFVPYEFH